MPTEGALHEERIESPRNSVGRIIKTAVITLALSTVVIGLLTPGSHYGTGAKIQDTRNTLSGIRMAMTAYKTEFGNYPSGDTTQMFRVLYGENPHHITFFERNPKRTQPDGELNDPWGTPYIVNASNIEHLVLRSAGPDKHFDYSPTTDDIFETPRETISSEKAIQPQ